MVNDGEVTSEMLGDILIKALSQYDRKAKDMAGLWAATKELSEKSGFNTFADSMVASDLKLGSQVGLLDKGVGNAAYDNFFNGNLEDYRKEKSEKVTALIKQTRDSVEKVGSKNTGQKFDPVIPEV